MSGNNTEPEAMPSTSKITESQKTAMFPLVSMPKIVLTRLDVDKLPKQLSVSHTTKKPVKRLQEKKSKPLVSKSLPKKAISTVKQGTRLRGRPKKDYKLLSETGKVAVEPPKTKATSGKIGIVKKPSNLTAKTEDKDENHTVRGMLKKTMLQKRSKIAIPPAKKPKLIPAKPTKPNTQIPKQKKEKANALPTPEKETYKTKSVPQTKAIDTDASEDEFLYDELIDELVNAPNKKVLIAEKTTNITLKPNVGNKPPTIVKGGIVKKSSLPPDLKSVSSPATLNSSRIAGTVLGFKSKPATVESIIKVPATAESPKASLPSKASPFPILINSPTAKTGVKGQGKKTPKKSPNTGSAVKDEPLEIVDKPEIAGHQSKVSQNPKPGGKSIAPISKPRGRPRIGPKQVMKIVPISISATEDESDEYTEIETLENVDSVPVTDESLGKSSTNANVTEDIQIIMQKNTSNTLLSDEDRSGTKSKKDVNPNLDLLKILTDDTEDASQSVVGKLKESDVDTMISEHEENPNASKVTSPGLVNPNSNIHEKSEIIEVNNTGRLEADNTSIQQAQENEVVPACRGASDSGNDFNELQSEPEKEEIQPVRTVYDLISEVSLQYPSWNLHIIPETNAFCIAQVTKGRLGLPTLKKCIELNPDTYSAKVYIHQYHIKRFDGVYDSEEAILALIEEIHSIKA